MSDPTTSVEPLQAESGGDLDSQRLLSERDELRAELVRRDEEILRLRDLLIGRDAELGAFRGQMQMIEDNSKRVTSVADRIPIPGARLLIGLFMRLISGRRG
jgi:hypothetical protein